MRRTWLNDPLTDPDALDAYKEMCRTIEDAPPCACGSGEPAQYPTLPNEPGICLICWFEVQQQHREEAP
jgi:hypothetical protein